MREAIFARAGVDILLGWTRSAIYRSKFHRKKTSRKRKRDVHFRGLVTNFCGFSLRTPLVHVSLGKFRFMRVSAMLYPRELIFPPEVAVPAAAAPLRGGSRERRRDGPRVPRGGQVPAGVCLELEGAEELRSGRATPLRPRRLRAPPRHHFPCRESLRASPPLPSLPQHPRQPHRFHRLVD